MAGTFFNKRNVDLNQGYIPRVEFKMFGNWEGTIQTVQRLSPAIKAAGLAAQIKICKAIAKKVKRHLKLQDLNWRQLDTRYRQRKERAGLDSSILMAYDTYYNNIEAWTKAEQHIAFVGVKKGMYTRTISGKRSKIDIATIAAVHEFSLGAKVPRRPLWNPTIAEIGGAKGLKSAYATLLFDGLWKRKIPVKKIAGMLENVGSWL